MEERPGFMEGSVTLALRRTPRALIAVALLAAATAVASPARAAVPKLDWRGCGLGAQCATAEVPLDYTHPGGDQITLALSRIPARDQAHRIGSLFVNFGGPGGSGADTVRAIGSGLFAGVNDRFDIVGFDPRGVGDSKPSIDCQANQETEGVAAQPFFTPENLDRNGLLDRVHGYIDQCLKLNPGILPYVSTANVARDMDELRQAVGDDKLSYLGFSYGTFLGATYAAMFPKNYRALVLDGALDADEYINRPVENVREQTEGFEREFGRFMQACAAHQDVCQFGGDDPWTAFDELAEKADVTPIPASGDDPRPVDGDDIRAATTQAVYAKQLWPFLAVALGLAEAGDGVGIRVISDFFYGRLDDGRYDPLFDRFFAISALEGVFPSDVDTLLAGGEHSWALFDHFWFNAGYSDVPWGLYPVEPRGVFRGPFSVPSSSPTVLVVGTTGDPATPSRGAKRVVRELDSARLLTMRGDGHTAYGGNSVCIDAAVDAYLKELIVPAAGTTCRQQVPFELPTNRAQALSTGNTHRSYVALGKIIRRFPGGR